MKVGFLGFGEVASAFSGWLKEAGVEVYTSLKNRSVKTQVLAEDCGVNTCKDNKTLAEISDILISAVTPAEAVNVAREVGKHVKGIYVDVNNISPGTAKEALGYIENGKTVDAAIIGGIKKEGIQVQIVASGSYAEQFSSLKQYGLNIKVISPDLGKAKTLKMLRSSYTKGVSALLLESLYSAYQMGLDEELMKCLESTECPGFRESALSRVKNSAYHAERKSQEMEEVIKFMKEQSQLGSTEEDEHPSMIEASGEYFKYISRIIELDKKPDSLKELFKSIED
jgi:3-hydroxyisobutyrate dehydrogenase-like beta-hydroxyacid dehydrogenase